MFREAAAGDPIVTPDHFVESSVFHARLAKEGIDRPEGFIEFSDWCDSIGLPAFAHKLSMAHHRARGTKGDPSREKAYRFHRRVVSA